MMKNKKNKSATAQFMHSKGLTEREFTFSTIRQLKNLVTRSLRPSKRGRPIETCGVTVLAKDASGINASLFRGVYFNRKMRWL